MTWPRIEPRDAATLGPRERLAERVLHVLAGLIVIAGVGAAVLRPMAPDLGPLPDPGRWFDAAHLSQVAAYRQPRYVVALAGLTVRVAVPFLVAFTPAGRRGVARVVARVGVDRPARAATAVILGVVVMTDLLVLPLVFWAGFVHDGAFGFRTQGLAGWGRDWVVATVPAWLLIGWLVPAGWWLAGRLPRLWPAVGGLAAAVLVAVLVTVSPLMLEPLRFATDPLPEGRVRNTVEAVVDASGRPLSEIVVADASRRTTRQNAYVSGLAGTRRMVLYDTLVEGQPPRIVAQVVAHELAHDRHRDLARGTLIGAAAVIVAAYGLQLVMTARVRHGRQRHLTDPQSAAVVLAAVVAFLVASAPVQTAVSRHMEAAADLGALELTQAPDVYLAQRLAVSRANLGDPDPPWWAMTLWSTHPPDGARLQLGERWPVEWRGVAP